MKYLLSILVLFFVYSCASPPKSSYSPNQFYILEGINYFGGCGLGDNFLSPDKRLVECEDYIPSTSEALILERVLEDYEIFSVNSLFNKFCIDRVNSFNYKGAKLPMRYLEHLPVTFFEHLFFDADTRNRYQIYLPNDSRNISCVYIDANENQFVGTTTFSIARMVEGY